MNLIELTDIKKIYKMGDQEIKALDGVSISIDQGEFVAIMGPSGSGKSTLMHIIGCLDDFTKGTYFLNSKNISKYSSNELAEVRNSEMGFVFQAYNLLINLSALENVMLPLAYAGKNSKGSTKENAFKLLKKVGLENRRRNRPVEMSGGEQQRVAIARALMMNPQIILADEPTGNLNSKGAREIIEILKELNEEGKTIIYVTHDEEIGAQAKRIVHVRDGKIIAREHSQWI